MPSADELRALRAAYRDVFGSPLGQLVVRDLRRFCRAGKSTYIDDDPAGRRSAMFEGRRSAVLYLEAMRDEGDDLLRALLEDQGRTTP